MEFPHANIDDNAKELFIRDIYFLNYHINHDKWDWFRSFTIQDAHRLELDFCCYDSDCWTVTTTERGSGSATETCIDAVNGVLRVTNAGDTDDQDELVYGCECWKLVDNYPLYAELRFKLEDPDNSSFWFGLVTGDQFFTAPNDYAVFHVDDGGDDLYFSTALNGAATDVDTAIDLEDDTWYRIGFHWDGQGTIRWFVFRDSDQYCIATGSVTTHICQDEEMNIGFGIRNDAADAYYLDVDYLKCVQQRVIE